MYVNARAIIQNEIDGENAILIQVRNKPYEGGKWFELPGGRVEEFESLVSALRREVREETGLEVTFISGEDTRLETGSADGNIECLLPFAVYQTIKGPVDSMGVYFLCRAAGELLAVGDETENIQWMPVAQVAQWMETNPEKFDWVDRAGLLYYLRSRKIFYKRRDAMWFNPMMVWLLKSPLHGFISKNVMLTTVMGRKSGKQISTPTNYIREGNTLWVISWRDRTWWKNLRGGAKAQLLLAGHNVEGCGQVIEEEKAVAQSLFEYYSKVPQIAKYVQINLDAAGKPIVADCEHAAQKMVVVQIDMT